MHLAGLSVHQARLCQPYGDDQRKGLWLFKILEPETWARVVERVEGANFGNRYVQLTGSVMGNIKINLPEGHTWRSYAYHLLMSMPPPVAAHYRSKIAIFLRWHRKHQTNPRGRIPDEADAKLEASRKAPSWRRICKVLLKNDYWCKGLSFSQTKREMERQLDLVTRYMESL
jgi:predicted phosphoadenosine phosphosulfate sulfurtransferase